MPTEIEPQAERSPTFGGSRPKSMPGGTVSPGPSAGQSPAVPPGPRAQGEGP